MGWVEGAAEYTDAFHSASPEAPDHGQSERCRSVHDLRPVVEQAVEVTTGCVFLKNLLMTHPQSYYCHASVGTIGIIGALGNRLAFVTVAASHGRCLRFFLLLSGKKKAIRKNDRVIHLTTVVGSLDDCCNNSHEIESGLVAPRLTTAMTYD